MRINPNLVYNIGQGGLIEGKLIFIHPYKIKKRPWVARCFRDPKTNNLEREFLEGYKEDYDGDHYLIEFDIDPFEVYQYGNIYLSTSSELYKSYAATSDEEFVEIELESVLVFMNLYKKKEKKKKKDKTPPPTNFVPDDIDF